MQSLHIAFLGCGFITRVHSRHLRRLRSEIVCSYASRDRDKAEQFRRSFGGQRSYASYEEAIGDPGVDAVVVVGRGDPVGGLFRCRPGFIWI